MSVAAEEIKIKNLIERVETIEEVADTLDDTDERREKLLRTARSALAEVSVVRPVVAARLLDISERTIRSWERAGVLRAAQREPRLMLDLCQVHEVMHLVRELRASGQTRDLLDAVWFRLADKALLDRTDLRESLDEMRRGRGRVIHPLPEDGVSEVDSPNADRGLDHRSS